jgi:hypothetical protein
MTIGQNKMPRASALAPQAVSGVRSFFINRVYKVDNSTGLLEFLIFLLPLSTARWRLRAEKRKRIKSHLLQIISHESGI